MFTHPHITTAVAAEHRRDLLAGGDRHRLARAATRQRGSRSPAIASRLTRIIRGTATTAAARPARTA